ncbi:hypothetical protein [Nonomuraea roseola]|uniref:Uncharacterized protein n=1 Tax=Nonomuraea roseola TaxID=46179 RepID=A0ABV5Q442_9ACTN
MTAAWVITAATLGYALVGPAPGAPAHAAVSGTARVHHQEPAPTAARPLIGDVIVFNDEIVEPVSAPVSTCGGPLPLFSSATISCQGASRVSDDDA